MVLHGSLTMADPDEDDAEEIIYHGTSVTIANKIFAAKRFDERETFFCVSKRLGLLLRRPYDQKKW
jgi:hypothetical protein